MDDHNERIRQRAYQIWLEEGCPEGRAEIHWEMAREFVANEGNGSATRLAPDVGSE
jgi:hypothetical protein